MPLEEEKKGRPASPFMDTNSAVVHIWLQYGIIEYRLDKWIPMAAEAARGNLDRA